MTKVSPSTRPRSSLLTARSARETETTRRTTVAVLRRSPRSQTTMANRITISSAVEVEMEVVSPSTSRRREETISLRVLKQLLCLLAPRTPGTLLVSMRATDSPASK